MTESWRECRQSFEASSFVLLLLLLDWLEEDVEGEDEDEDKS
jgi:hypothetical protein